MATKSRWKMNFNVGCAVIIWIKKGLAGLRFVRRFFPLRTLPFFQCRSLGIDDGGVWRQNLLARQCLSIAVGVAQNPVVVIFP